MKNKLKFPDKKFLNRTEPQKECEHIIDENEAVKGNYQCELCGCQVFQPQEEAKSIEEKAKYVTRKIFLRLLNNHNIISTDMQIHIKEVLIEEYASQFQTEQRQVTDEEIEKYLIKKYAPIFIDGGSDINKYFRECSFEDMKWMRDKIMR